MENPLFLEIILCGTKLISSKKFYEFYDDYKKRKERVPLFLYSFNFIDKFEFEFINDETRFIQLCNRTTGQKSKFDIGDYILEEILNSKNLFELKSIEDDDLRLEIEGKELKVFLNGELEDFFKENNNNMLDVEFAMGELFFDDLLKYASEFQQISENLYKFFMENKTVVDINKDYDKLLQLITEFNMAKNFDFEEVRLDDSYDKLKVIFLEELTEEAKSLFQTNKFDLEKTREKIFNKWIVELLKVEATNDLASVFGIDVIENMSKDFVLKKMEHKFEDLKEFLDSFIVNSFLKGDYEKICKINSTGVIVASLDIWEIIGDKKFEKYIEKESFRTQVLENQYIGQSFGNNGERNVLDRIGEGHEKLQRIISTKPENRDVAIMFFIMTPKNHLMIKEFGSVAKDEVKRLLEKNEISNKEYVDLAELGLITYFRPPYNTQHVNDNFKSLTTTKVQGIFNKHDGIQIIMDYENVNWKIVSGANGKDFSSEKSNIQCYFKKNISISNIKINEELFEL